MIVCKKVKVSFSSKSEILKYKNFRFKRQPGFIDYIKTFDSVMVVWKWKL